MMLLTEPNRCPIYVSRMILFAECVSAKPLPDPHHLHGCMKSVSRQYENKGENEGENKGENKGRDEGGDAAKSKQSHLYNRI